MSNLETDLKKYVCSSCGKAYDRPLIRKTSYEDFYGIDADYGNRHSIVVLMCPYCKSEEEIIDSNNVKYPKF